MKRRIILTKDGSSTIYVESLNENYHSNFGAIGESMHVFINTGFSFVKKEKISILEIGFGTGLNAYLSLQQAILTGKKVQYFGIEKYPVVKEEWESLNYSSIICEIHSGEFDLIHTSSWDQWIKIDKNFDFYKSVQDLRTFDSSLRFDIIYFDAFSPDVQPELWTPDIFKKMYKLLNTGGILVSYSVKGIVKRNLVASGFQIKRLPGPEGKRHILRAVKN